MFLWEWLCAIQSECYVFTYIYEIMKIKQHMHEHYLHRVGLAKQFSTVLGF